MTIDEINELTQKFADVAQREVGYTESADGSSKYGTWFGNTYGDWCIMFIAWCADQAGILTSKSSDTCPMVPRVAGTRALKNFYINSNRFLAPIMVPTNPNYPKVGDVVLIRNSGASTEGHAGIIVAVDGNQITTVEGNAGSAANKVARVTYTNLVASFGATILYLLSNHVSY